MRHHYPLISVIMIDESKYLQYLEEQQALVCRNCKHCLQPDGVEDHLRRKDGKIPLDIRKKLVSYAESLTLRNPSEVIMPTTIVPAFDSLEVIQGFRCSFCSVLYGTPNSIEKHCRSHKWTRPEGIRHVKII